MNIKLKPIQMVCVAALVVIVIALAVVIGGSTEKQVRTEYDALKEGLGLTDLLQEDEVSYSLLSRTLVIENPSIRLSQDMIPGGNSDMVRSVLGMADAALSQQQESVLSQSLMRSYEALAMRERVALYFDAKEIRLKRSGDDKDGFVSMEVVGIDLSRPYLTSIASELVGPKDNPEETSPRTSLNERGNAFDGNLRWSHNAINKVPGSGSFIVDSMGLYGATLNAKLEMERSSDGEGELRITLTHRVNGSEVGRIERKAVFAKMPELDQLAGVAQEYVRGYALLALGSRIGVVRSSFAGEKLLRDSKLESYDVAYKGYGDMDKVLVDAGDLKDTELTKACSRLALSSYELSKPSKEKVKIDDSNCTIAASLAKNGKYSESYTFNEDKTAFSELMVNENYKVEVN